MPYVIGVFCIWKITVIPIVIMFTNKSLSVKKSPSITFLVELECWGFYLLLNIYVQYSW